MKKIYLAVALTFFSFLLCVKSTYAQYTPAETYETVLAGGDLSNPATWNGNIPSILNPCDHCKIILHGTVNVDLHVVLQNNSLVVVSAGTTLTPTVVNVNAYVVINGGTQVQMFSNTQMFVNDEFDLATAAFISLADNTSIIDATNGGNHAVLGPLGPAVTAAGVYYQNNPGAFPTAGSYQNLVNSVGFGDPTFGPPVTYPGTPGIDRFFVQYEINCVDPPPPLISGNCAPGVVYGPATSGLDPVYTIYDFTGGSALPVRLVQFIAQQNQDGSNKISWATSQEENASHFDVERSGDAGSWTKLGSVAAKGFSSITTNYSYNDVQPLATTNYYRLKMVDLDGKFAYSKIATVSTDTKGQSLVIYNNPFTDMIRIKVNTNSVDNLSLTVTDMVGKTYFQQIYKARSGDNYININPNAAAGLYILHVQGRGFDRTVKLVKE